jgi:hypothetical protein
VRPKIAMILPILLAILIGGCGNLKFVCDNRGGQQRWHPIIGEVGWTTCENTDKDREDETDAT